MHFILQASVRVSRAQSNWNGKQGFFSHLFLQRPTFYLKYQLTLGHFFFSFFVVENVLFEKCFSKTVEVSELSCSTFLQSEAIFVQLLVKTVQFSLSFCVKQQKCGQHGPEF